ncbi:hypothetical protein PR048_009095 [Dryococelus australis]|uniref:FP protein C-terminal domain-containing protein n=1 Tax=Dryococelus australis TaxID=614101 RepID=A0ABQ9HYX3_9NEOP|nr:hypothetical protein PR048_009095 [Dryococelus australis]
MTRTTRIYVQINIPNGAVSKDENNAEIVVKLGKHLGVDIEHQQTDACHRMLSRSKEFPPILLVKFCSKEMKNVLLSAKKKTRNLESTDIGMNASSRMVYLNEHLSPNNRILFKKTMELKQHGFKYVWTKDCMILVRKNEAASVKHIATNEDLQQLLQENK